jgi:histidyl-tRNA synthetase
MIQALRGMKDILDSDSEKFEYFIENASKIARRYNYSYIETPLLEETALFKRSVGESSDIVNKEMYQFIDKGENDVCLRPEGTAGVVRSFIQNKFDRAGGVKRFYYYGPMFRYERPQKGRLREFHQFGCESFGVDSVYEDINTILMIKDILEFFNISFTLKLNSLGCKECMPSYKDDLVSSFDTFKDELCSDCQRRIETNPIRVLDCKNEKCQELLKESPKLLDNLCSSCDSDFDTLIKSLKEIGVEFELDSNLVRGLDYYSKTAFEFVSNEIGAQSAIAGGGRYDRLVEFLGGKPTNAIGFAIGIERILDLITVPNSVDETIYVGIMSDDAISYALSLVNQKRKSKNVIFEYKRKGFSKHLNIASKYGVKYCCLIGEDEVKNSQIWTKDIISQDEKVLSREEFLDL